MITEGDHSLVIVSEKEEVKDDDRGDEYGVTEE